MNNRFALAWLLLVAAPAAAQQRTLDIQRFDATIRVNTDASIDVTEAITVSFNGSWNGIYRSIPVIYRNAQGLNWTLGIDVVDATDDRGNKLRVEAKRDRHYLKVKMWVPGAQDVTRTITLRYRAANGLRFFDEHDELYWNVTGDEWDVPLGWVTAKVELPGGAAGIRATAFNGVYGSTSREATIETQGTTVGVKMTRTLSFREGLTVVVGWNKGLVSEPSIVARGARVLWTNWPLLLPLPVLVFGFMSWNRRGRDPERRPVAVQYEPPKDMTPGEAGTLIDHSADMRDITATLVDLAVRGHVRFEEVDHSKLLGLFSSKDYRLQRLTPEGAAPLAPHEQLVLSGIFDSHGSSVLLSDLENEFYSRIPKISSSIYDRLLDKGYYRARPDKVTKNWIGGGIMLGLLVGAGGAALAHRTYMTPVPFIVSGALIALIMILFATVMPARTESGARAFEQILGFLEFLRRVESENLKRIIIGHPEMFDRFLPYAMAFGVEKKWAAAFEGIYTEPPRWYVGASPLNFSVMHLSSSLSGFSSKVGSTLQSSPRSSSGSGFGGGGSSGGGGGGGGGGGF